LERMVRENRPWTEVVEEILLARPLSEEQKGAVWFLYERNNDHQKIAESIAPAIFGLRIECAQCHDHMMVDEIKQSHYWGLVAFFNRSKNEKSEGVLRVSESAVGGFSEFADIEGSSTPNYLTFLDTEVVPEERPEKSDKQEDSDGLYLTSERPQVGRVPKFSRREKFVQEVLRDHPRLAMAFTNRIWAILMGRGIVHPFDEMDSMHEPSHPELLDWLSKDTKAHQFDLRRLVRGLVRSEAYQKSSVRPKGAEDPATFAWYIERPLTGEQLARSTMQVLHGRGDAEAVGIFRQQFPEVLPRDYVTTVKKALFLTNSDDFDRLIQSSTAPDDLVPRLISSGSRKDQIDQLFQTVFARTPDAGEREAIGDYLDNRRDDPTQAMQQVVWSMLTSAEFRFNH
ncbi:DUF1549 and DUF1553 domain-containing protein, partial [bacterium]|nr:DUF1549 and DUF1553 domain-containing protein [bacterium]